MEQNVKIICSPFNSSLEVVDKMVMKLHVPYSANDVTIQFNPNIQDYKESDDKQDVKIRQMSISIPTEQTKTLKFDFGSNNIHDIEVENTSYNVKLMSIGKENIQGQDFPTFEFLTSWN